MQNRCSLCPMSKDREKDWIFVKRSRKSYFHQMIAEKTLRFSSNDCSKMRFLLKNHEFCQKIIDKTQILPKDHEKWDLLRLRNRCEFCQKMRFLLKKHEIDAISVKVSQIKNYFCQKIPKQTWFLPDKHKKPFHQKITKKVQFLSKDCKKHPNFVKKIV